MKLTKITPRGFCKGVVDAWALCRKVAKENPNKEIYLIGWLVHNKNMIEDIEKLSIKTIDDVNISREEIISSIDKNKNPIVIFSAHGTNPKVIEYARNIGLEVYDATCIYVTNVQKLIKEKINNGYQIIYIGVRNHPESNSILSLHSSIQFVSDINDIDKIVIDPNNKIFVTNQTTISIYEFYDIVKRLKIKYKNIEFKNDICNAAKERQEAVINMDDTIDLLLVVGDKKSNNTNKLCQMGIKKNVETYLVSNLSEIDYNWFINKKHVGITSGCSTPTWVTNSIITKLEEYIRGQNGKNNC